METSSTACRTQNDKGLSRSFYTFCVCICTRRQTQACACPSHSAESGKFHLSHCVRLHYEDLRWRSSVPEVPLSSPSLSHLARDLELRHFQGEGEGAPVSWAAQTPELTTLGQNLGRTSAAGGTPGTRPCWGGTRRQATWINACVARNIMKRKQIYFVKQPKCLRERAAWNHMAGGRVLLCDFGQLSSPPWATGALLVKGTLLYRVMMHNKWGDKI